jgi:MFS family permease
MNRPGQTRRFALPTALRSFALPNYRRWAAADLVSNVGSWMSTAALGWLVFATTGSAAALGAVVAVKQAPALLFGLLGGTFADRFDARRVLPFTQGAYAVLAAALAAVTLTGHAQVWHIYTYAVVTGALGVLDGPCFGRLLAQVLGPRHLSNGIALGSVTHSTGWVVGLGLGSAILAGPGAGAVFAIDAASFAFVVVTVLRLRPELMHPLERARAGHDRMRDGLRYVLGNRRLVVVLALGAVTGAVGRHFQVTIAAMAQTVFDGGPGLYGRLFTCFSVGAFVGAAVAARLRALRVPAVLVAAGAAAAVQLASGLAPTTWVFGAAMLAVAACSVVYDTAVSTVVQTMAPGHLRGRVIAVQGLVASVASIAGAPTLGWLCDHVGARQALVIGGTVSLAGVLVAVTVLAGSPRRAAARTMSAVRRARPSFELAA